MLRRRAEGPERLRRRSRHDLPGHLDHRFPGQCVEVRPGRHLRQHRAAGRQARLAQADLTRSRRDGQDSRKRRMTMNAAIEPTACAAMPPPLSCLADRRPRRDQLQARAPGRDPRRRPQRGFFEVHAENYMGAGGPPHRALEALRRDHPVSLHGVCMSIGGEQPLDRAHLARFRAWSSATSRRWSPSIWPGRRTRPPISTTCCRCPTPRRRCAGLRPHRRGAGGDRPADPARKPVDLCRVRRHRR